MKNWQEIQKEFGKFGWADFECRYAYGYPSPDEVSVTIYIDPTKLPNADLATDVGVRKACFELAEQAIAYAREHFTLADGPRYETTGELHWTNWRLGKFDIITNARLELRFFMTK